MTNILGVIFIFISVLYTSTHLNSLSRAAHSLFSDMKLACCAIWCRLWELISVLLDKKREIFVYENCIYDTQCDTILNA
jgi:hypothetical protein